MTNTAPIREAPVKQKQNGDGHLMDFHDEHAAQRLAPEKIGESVAIPSKPETPPQAGRRPWVWALVGAAVVAAAAAGVYYYIQSLSFESTDDAFIEAHIVPVSSRVPGHVANVLVTDNQWVEKGTLLAEIDPPDFKTRLTAAEAALQTARSTCAARATGVAGARAGLAQAKADYTAAVARRERAEAKLKRIASLVPDHAASQDSLDEATAAVQVTQADLTAVGEKVHVQESNVDQALSAAAAAESAVKQAEAEVKQVGLSLSYTKIYAPISGHVTRKSVEKGAFIQVGQPLMALVDPDMWVIANFKETQLAKMEPGQPVIVTVDAHPDVKFPAHIDSVQRGSGARFSLLPPENATGNYVKVVQRVPVKIVFDDPELVEKYGLGPGMSVIPIVKINERSRSITTAAATK